MVWYQISKAFQTIRRNHLWLKVSLIELAIKGYCHSFTLFIFRPDFLLLRNHNHTHLIYLFTFTLSFVAVFLLTILLFDGSIDIIYLDESLLHGFYKISFCFCAQLNKWKIAHFYLQFEGHLVSFILSEAVYLHFLVSENRHFYQHLHLLSIEVYLQCPSLLILVFWFVH